MPAPETIETDRPRAAHIAGVLLAAGASRRLGTPKQLLRDADDVPLLAALTHSLLESVPDTVTVVTGRHAEAVRLLLDDTLATDEQARVRLVHNPNWMDGMASSIRAALAAVGNADAMLLVACDQPTVSAAHLRALCARYRSHGERVVSAYGDTRGIPAVWPRRDFAALAALVGDRGAKGLLTGREEAIALADGALDLDTPDDVARWRASAPASPPAGTRPDPRD